MSDRVLPLLVAAMAFLAALAMAGWFGAAALARHWQEGAGAALTCRSRNRPIGRRRARARGWRPCWLC